MDVLWLATVASAAEMDLVARWVFEQVCCLRTPPWALSAPALWLFNAEAC